LVLVGDVLQKDFYAIAMPTNSKYQEYFNQQIIKNIQNNFISNLAKKYLE
jgi:hypothetical protein